MSLHRPRRIFRGRIFRGRVFLTGGLALPWRSAAALLGGALLLAGAGYGVAALHSSGPTAKPEQHTLALSAQPAQIAVVDSGTLRLQDRVVRLLGVEPAARGKSCRTADSRTIDCGSVAASALAALVRTAPVTCEVHNQDAMGRPMAICRTSGTVLNSAVVAAGWARAADGLPGLRQQEAQARQAHRGLWAFNADW